jgi:3-oxoacyl-[acyl-carrier protein] reductase
MKLIIVTGATRGLGFAITKMIAINENYRIVATGRKLSESLKSFISDNELNDRVIYQSLDLNDLGNIHNFINEMTEKYGPLYALINNAAIGHDGILATMHEKDIAELLKVNLHAPILLSKYACRKMLLSKEGRIIHISSVIVNSGFNGLAVYGATKAGLVGLTKSLARELGKGGITVNAICPGYMETKMTSGLSENKLASIRRRSPSGKLAKLNDVAATVNFLLEPSSSSITGTTITVDAGSSA